MPSIFEQAKEAVQADTEPEIARDFMEELSDEQVYGIVTLDIRAIADDVIARCIGVETWMLPSIRSSDKYKEAMGRNASSSMAQELQVDDQWDKLETESLGVLLDDIKYNGKNMQTVELLSLARAANSANRRHGMQARNKQMQYGGVAQPGVIDARTQNTTVMNISLPQVLVQQLTNIAEGSHQIRTEEELTDKYKDFTNSNMDMDKVGSLLSVDLSKAANKGATMDELMIGAMNASIGSSEKGSLISEEPG